MKLITKRSLTKSDEKSTKLDFPIMQPPIELCIVSSLSSYKDSAAEKLCTMLLWCFSWYVVVGQTVM